VGGAYGTHGRRDKSVKGFGGKARRKEPLERPRCRWKDEIRMDFREIGWGDRADSVCSGWAPVAGPCENGDEPSGCGSTELVC
jgi:hypothetical protein